jgi:hypothetical protein
LLRPNKDKKRAAKKKRHRRWSVPPIKLQGDLVVVVAIVFVIAIVFVVAVAVMVAAVVIVIPSVVVFYAAAVAFPVTGVKAFTIVARADPAGSSVRRPRPVALMPAVVAADGIPITADPYEIWSGLRGQNGYSAGRWRCANSNTNSDLRIAGLRSDEQQCQKQSGSDEIFHVYVLLSPANQTRNNKLSCARGLWRPGAAMSRACIASNRNRLSAV